MAMRFRIPLLIDFVATDDAEEIRALVDDNRLDRVTPEGPWLNRLIIGRIRRLLSFGGKPLPTMMERNDRDRAAAQQALAERLSQSAQVVVTMPEEILAPIVDFVRGGGSREAAAMALQATVGRLFDPDYGADAASWRAAKIYDRAVSSRNPLSWAVTAVTGRARRSRALLGKRIGKDVAGLHATGIAVHNMVATAERMRALYAGGAVLTGLDATAAANAAFAGPRAIVRQVVRPADTVVGGLKPGTLVNLKIRATADHRMDSQLALMEGEWSACPAGSWLRAIYREIWTRARRMEDRP